MSNDPRDEMQPQPEDDDETLRRKMLARTDPRAAWKMEAQLHDPLYLEGVRENLRRQRENEGKPPSPGKKPQGFNTGQFEFAKAIVEGKIQVIRGPNADVVDSPEITDQVSGEREIERSGEIDPVIAKAVAALAARQHETVEGLGQLGAAKPSAIVAPATDELPTPSEAMASPVTDETSTLTQAPKVAASVTDEMSTLTQAPKVAASVTDEMSTLERPKLKALESDEMSTIPGGRYADDPRKQQQQAVVRVEPKGSVATAALGVMKTDAMPAQDVPISAPSESAPPSSAWTAGRKPKLKILTDRVATVDAAAATAFAAAGAADAAPRSFRQVDTEPLPTAGAASEREDAPEVPVTRSRAWVSVIVVALVLLIIGYVARRPTSESNGTPSTSASMIDAPPAPPPTVVAIATTAAPVVPTASAAAPPSTSPTAESTSSAATSVSARPTKPPNASPLHPSAATNAPPSARPTSPARTPDPYEKPNHP